jgi:hypothetical protein
MKQRPTTQNLRLMPLPLAPEVKRLLSKMLKHCFGKRPEQSKEQLLCWL